MQLDQNDCEEPRRIFLGSRRRDTNLGRSQVLASLDTALADYSQESHLMLLSKGKSTDFVWGR